MAPVKWSVPEVFAVGTHKPVAPQPRHEAIATTARAKPRARSVLPHTHVALAPLEESVQLTPGGRRKHTLRRTSPGGTTRCSQYISPNKAEIHNPGDTLSDDERGMQSLGEARRIDALHQVPCQQSDAQRSKKARMKRKAAAPAGAAPASQAKRAPAAPASLEAYVPWCFNDQGTYALVVPWRTKALIEVPGAQSDAQRSACARAKRTAGVPAAPAAPASLEAYEAYVRWCFNAAQ